MSDEDEGPPTGTTTTTSPPTHDEEGNPEPVATDNLWDLEAHPATLETMATAWRGLKTQAGSAWRLVYESSGDVLGNQEWTGDTADAYATHRSRVTSGITSLRSSSGPVATALDEAASVLRVNQGLLDDEWSRLRSIRHEFTDGGRITFHPADDTELTRLNNAISAARDIRTHVNNELIDRRDTLNTRAGLLSDLAGRWSPLVHVNLNIGSGNDNTPFDDKEGADYEEIPEIADLIVDQNADIVTLQEVFEDDVDRIVERLEERTGDEWVFSYSPATSKPRWSEVAQGGGGGLIPGNPIDLVDEADESFGNVVLVRVTDAVDGTPQALDPVTLDEPTETPDGTPSEAEEGRSTAGMEIRLTGDR